MTFSRKLILFRTLFLVPFALPAYVEIITWLFILQKNNRAVNAFLSLLHVTNPPFWLSCTAIFPPFRVG